jgi:glycerophosphoryl diester phosphodiesterase
MSRVSLPGRPPRSASGSTFVVLAVVLSACGDNAPAGVDLLVRADLGSARDAPSSRDLHDLLARDAPILPAVDRPAAPKEGAVGPDAAAPSHRSSLAVCWTDATCKRVMTIAHGGAWDLTQRPYDSNAAIAEAYTLGIDGVKIDVRVTQDNVPVIAHSSPIEFYESLDCVGKKIEAMTAAQVVKCHRFPSATETFQRLDDVLAYLRGKMVTQLCVKRPEDYARTIAELQAQKAEDFAFIELGSTQHLKDLIPTLPGAGAVWYLVNVEKNVAEVDTIVGTIKNPRAFMVEFDPSVAVAALTAQKLHPAGVRSFTYTSSMTASVQELKALFDGGYDVVSAQLAANAVQARILVNQARGVSPP